MWSGIKCELSNVLALIKRINYVVLGIHTCEASIIVRTFFFRALVANIGATFEAPLQLFHSMCFDIRIAIN